MGSHRFNAIEEPGFGVAPVALDGAFGEFEKGGDLLFAKAGKKAKLHNLGPLGGLCLQFIEGVTELEERFVLCGLRDFKAVQFDFLGVAPMTNAQAAPGTVDQEVAHRFRRGGEKVAMVLPLALLACGEFQIHLVDEGSSLQTLSGRKQRQFVSGEFPQFVVDGWQETLSGVRVALINCAQQSREFGHEGTLLRGARDSSWKGESGREWKMPLLRS